MTPVIVIITIVAYFALLFGISWFASRGSDNSTFFTGNRQAHWGIVAFAMIGAAVSGVTFISVPGMVADKGYSYLQMVLGFIVGYFTIAYVLVPMFYKRNLISIYGYLEGRFGRNTYRAGAWFFFLREIAGPNGGKHLLRYFTMEIRHAVGFLTGIKRENGHRELLATIVGVLTPSPSRRESTKSPS